MDDARPAAARLTLDHIYVAALLAVVAVRVLLTPIPPEDFWWHLATGRLIATEGRIPVVDEFSFTHAGEPFFNQSWLAQLLLYGLYQAGGFPLIILVQAGVFVLTYALLLRLCLLRSDRLRLSVALLLATVPITFTNWIVRPQSYVLPIFAAFILVLAEYRLGRSRRLWLLPALMALWVNLHGSFVLGVALLGGTLVGMLIESLRGRAEIQTITGTVHSLTPTLRAFVTRHSSLVVWSVLTALATLLNPRGLDVLGYVRNLTGSSQVTLLVREWAPPTVREPLEALFFLFVIAFFLALAYTRRRPALTDLLLFLPFLWLGLGAVRSVIWCVFLAVPLLAGMVAGLLAPPRARSAPGSMPLNVLLLAVIALLLLAATPWARPLLRAPGLPGLIPDDTPIAAVEALRADPRPPQRLFHEHGFGSYLIWAAPEQKVFIDPRIELYPFAQIQDYLNLSQGLSVAELFEHYRIDGALLSKDLQKPLVAALERDPAWEVRYTDDHTIYLVRRP